MNNNVTTKLHDAILNNQFIPYIQPIVNNHGGIIGGELLARWKDDEGHVLTPDFFIRDIEKYGLMLPFTTSLIHNFIQTIQDCDCIDVFPPNFHLALNVSPSALMYDSLVTLCERLLEVVSSDIRLTLEVTERDEFVVNEFSLLIIDKLKKLGIQFSLDDYGTGLSNLMSLSCIEFEFIKIDRTFVSKIGSCEKGLNIIKNILDLASRFDCQVIAEGVENFEQMSTLLMLGVPLFQGYYFYKPIEIKQFFNSMGTELEMAYTNQ